MSLMSARIRCGESGHMWEDAVWYIRPAAINYRLRDVWERTQHCIRPGCERTRRDRVEPVSYQLLSRVYGGRIERLGRLTKEYMRREII